MERPLVKVAVVKSDNRRGAVAQALNLLANDLKDCSAEHVLIKPNLVSHQRQLPSTHADTLSATLDAVFAAGAVRATIAEGASDASAGFRRFGYHREVYGRPVDFLDINRDETEWLPLQLSAMDGSSLTARVSKTISENPFRVSLALAKTHVTSIVTLSLKNMLSSIHPADRIMMHGSKGGNGYAGWKKLAVEFLKGDSFAVNWLTRCMGRLKSAQGNHDDRPGAWKSLNQKQLGFLRSVEAMNRNLVALSKVVKPHLSIVDGFIGMHREGPRHGTPLPLGVVIAGTDAVAVDAVAAAVMGFNPLRIGYLAYAEAAGLGSTCLDQMTIVGDPISSVRRRFVPHSNYSVARYWDRMAILNGPHVRARATELAEVR
jgi:uncharacterized protein (DUF362 family)